MERSGDGNYGDCNDLNNPATLRNHLDEVGGTRHQSNTASPFRLMIMRPASVSIVAAFLILATIIAEVVAYSLLVPGTILDKIWMLNEPAYKDLSAIGLGHVALLLFLLGFVTAFASWGLLHGRKWAWWTTIVILSINGIGDMLTVVLRRDALKGVTGIVIAGLFLLLLLTTKTRYFFSEGVNRSQGQN